MNRNVKRKKNLQVVPNVLMCLKFYCTQTFRKRVKSEIKKVMQKVWQQRMI